MKRNCILLSLLACLVTAGCCMCAGPYDYCAPTFTGQSDECGDDCRPHARLGSAFSFPAAGTAFAEDGVWPEAYDSFPMGPGHRPEGVQPQGPLPPPEGSYSSYDARRRIYPPR